MIKYYCAFYRNTIYSAACADIYIYLLDGLRFLFGFLAFLKV